MADFRKCAFGATIALEFRYFSGNKKECHKDDKAKKKSQELIDKSIKILEKFGKKAKNLIDLTEFIISRTK